MCVAEVAVFVCGEREREREREREIKGKEIQKVQTERRIAYPKAKKIVNM